MRWPFRKRHEGKRGISQRQSHTANVRRELRQDSDRKPRCGPWIERGDGSVVCEKCGDVDYPGTGPMGF